MTHMTALPQGLSGSTRDERLRASYDYCQWVTRRQAKNFYYGLKLTPQPKRSAMYAVYAWMRAADDLADEPGDPEEKTKRLEAFRGATVVAINPEQELPLAVAACGEAMDHGLIWPAVRKTVIDFQIPVRYLHAMIDGQLLDQKKTRYDTFEELYEYCYQVASVVGLVCMTVWGYTGGQATEKMAEHRGVALQLTNILRDLVEDARRDRVYLPLEDLKRCGYTPDAFARCLIRGQSDGAFEDLMAQQVARAQGYYELSADLERRIEPSCRPTSWAMMTIYHRLLGKIARRPRAVLNQKVRLGYLEKLAIGFGATMNRGLGR